MSIHKRKWTPEEAEIIIKFVNNELPGCSKIPDLLPLLSPGRDYQCVNRAIRKIKKNEDILDVQRRKSWKKWSKEDDEKLLELTGGKFFTRDIDSFLPHFPTRSISSINSRLYALEHRAPVSDSQPIRPGKAWTREADEKLSELTGGTFFHENVGLILSEFPGRTVSSMEARLRVLRKKAKRQRLVSEEEEYGTTSQEEDESETEEPQDEVVPPSPSKEEEEGDEDDAMWNALHLLPPGQLCKIMRDLTQTRCDMFYQYSTLQESIKEQQTVYDTTAETIVQIEQSLAVLKTKQEESASSLKLMLAQSLAFQKHPEKILLLDHRIKKIKETLAFPPHVDMPSLLKFLYLKE